MSNPVPYTIVFRSTTVPDDAAIAVRVAPAWDQGPDIPCAFNADERQWSVTLVSLDPVEDVVFKFICEKQWQLDPNLRISARELGTRPHIFDDRSVSFAAGDWLTVDVPLPARKMFDEPLEDPLTEFDTIVIGSGAGGGTLAYDLVGHGRGQRRVLVLEAGSYLFPTHVGNLPRRAPVGPAVAGDLWDLWWDYRTLRWTVPDPARPSAAISQALSLGGRTVFWGALAPRAKEWEFASWPEVISESLRNRWYEEAEQLMRVRKLASSAYQSLVQSTLQRLAALQDYTHIDAPVATEYLGRGPSVVPAGIFSTAELLIERKLQRAADRSPRYPGLHIRLNHEVTSIETNSTAAGETSATNVIAYDHRAGQQRSFRVAKGGSVVLAAGSLGSPLIVQASELGTSTGLVGRGLTDHPIYVVKFSIPPTSKWFSQTESSMTLSRYRAAGDAERAHPYNAKLSLNTRLTQSRFVDPDEFRDLMATGNMPCELVFLLAAPLVDGNQVTPDPTKASRPVISMSACTVDPEVQAAMDAYADAVLEAFDGVAGPNDRSYAPLGGVSHEGGTMRIGSSGGTPLPRGVVDEHLRLDGCDNVYVCDLSVFPSCLAANPTLTLVALALRLAEHLCLPATAVDGADRRERADGAGRQPHASSSARARSAAASVTSG